MRTYSAFCGRAMVSACARANKRKRRVGLACESRSHALSQRTGPRPRIRGVISPHVTRPGGTTTSRERLINIFMSVFVYILTFIQKTSSKSKSSDCSELDSEIILSECRIVGALEGTRLELDVRLVTLQLYTYWYDTAVQNFKNYRCWSVERRQVPHLNLGHHCHTQETRAVTPFV